MFKLLSGVRRFSKYLLPVVGLVPVAFGIGATLENFVPERAAALPAAAAVDASNEAGRSNKRVALVIGNANYPDAGMPLAHTVKDANDLADELRRSGFDVDVHENLGKEAMKRAIAKFAARIKPGAVALISYGGFGVQAGRQSYLIPVDAHIWREADVRRDGISIESVVGEMHGRGASVKLAILDASRRNPFERRFRGLSAGLTAVDAPHGALILSAAAPGTVVRDAEGENGILIGSLRREIGVPGRSAEDVFNRTRISASRASKGEQTPWVSSSLAEEFVFVPTPPHDAGASGTAPVAVGSLGTVGQGAHLVEEAPDKPVSPDAPTQSALSPKPATGEPTAPVVNDTKPEKIVVAPVRRPGETDGSYAGRERPRPISSSDTRRPSQTRKCKGRSTVAQRSSLSGPVTGVAN